MESVGVCQICISAVGLSFVLEQDPQIHILYSSRNPGKVEVSNLDKLGESYASWIPVELGLVLKSTGKLRVERDLGYEHF